MVIKFGCFWFNLIVNFVFHSTFAIYLMSLKGGLLFSGPDQKGKQIPWPSPVFIFIRIGCSSDMRRSRLSKQFLHIRINHWPIEFWSKMEHGWPESRIFMCIPKVNVSVIKSGINRVGLRRNHKDSVPVCSRGHNNNYDSKYLRLAEL